ncbi:MAG: TraR/DksA family transcriptional regulator [Phycisphaerales bacterium]
MAPAKPAAKAPAKPSAAAASAKSVPSKAAVSKAGVKKAAKPEPVKAAPAKSAPAKAPPAKSAAAKVDPKKAAPAASKSAAAPAKVDSKKGAAAPASGKAPTKADGKKGAGGSSTLEPPSVPKKGPIDLAQHKSVAAAAAAIVSARGEGDGFVIINGRRVRAISTKGMTVAKKSKSAAVEAPAAPTETEIRSIKTKLGKKELDEYRTLLLAKRKQLVGMLSGMEDEALRSSGGNLSNMPVHMADMGSDVYDQDFTLGMAETERAILGEIDAALQRIEDKTFGVCQMTGKPISKARLDAKPWAKYTIEAERIAETGGPR